MTVREQEAVKILESLKQCGGHWSRRIECLADALRAHEAVVWEAAAKVTSMGKCGKGCILPHPKTHEASNAVREELTDEFRRRAQGKREG